MKTIIIYFGARRLFGLYDLNMCKNNRYKFQNFYFKRNS